VRNIFLIIRRYFNFLFFIVLQIMALYLLFSYNKYHESAWLEVAHEVTGRVGGKYNNITYYFHLKKTNEELVKANELLRNQLTQQYTGPDTSVKVVQDTVSYDSSGGFHKYIWRQAKVVNNTVSLPNNMLTIERGENQGVKKDMGVISPSGVVGTVISTSGNYAVVMSMLNRQSRISSKLKKTGETGIVLWDGINPGFVIMNNIPKNVVVAIGDSVVTSNYSYLFPPDILVGTVAEIVENKSSNFYTLRLKTATNFFSVEHVMVVENVLKDEQKRLEAATKIND
jgi:rod shape-determining protein MreC